MHKRALGERAQPKKTELLLDTNQWEMLLSRTGGRRNPKEERGPHGGAGKRRNADTKEFHFRRSWGDPRQKGQKKKKNLPSLSTYNLEEQYTIKKNKKSRGEEPSIV